MSLDTLLKAAEYVESSSGPNTKANLTNARATGNVSNIGFGDRRRVVSESDASERRRRPGGAGTRETHNKLEKNRRAHLKECFDVLKNQVPSLEEHSKASNLNILRSALKYIQTIKDQEQEHISEVDLLKMSNQTLIERLDALKTKSKVGEKLSATSTIQASGTSMSRKPNSLPSTSQSDDSRILPISVATQTSPTLEKDGKYEMPGSVSELVEVLSRNTHVSTSSTDTGLEGDDLDRKISVCDDDDDDEKTDTDEGLDNDDDDDQDIEIDVVGQDDNSSSESLRRAAENNTVKTKLNSKLGVDKKKGSPEPKAKSCLKVTKNCSARKRSKSEMKCEEDSDYDENTKEEPKAKIQACARVSV